MLLKAWARDGWSKQDIATKKIGIQPQTLCEWQNKYPELAEALKQGKEPYDVEIENALHDSAKGYFVTVKEPIKLKTVKQKQGEGRIEEEHVEYVERQMYIPPQTAAQIFYLKNRKPDKWREKREIVANINENAFKNMSTIAALINNPEPDVEIEDNTRREGADDE